MKDMYCIRTPLLVLLLISILTGKMWGQESVAPVIHSGTEYLIGFPKSDIERTHQFMGLLITAESTTPVTVEIPVVPASDLEPITTFQSRSFIVRKGRDTLIEIPRPVEPRFIEEASLATVRVTSRAPISVTVISARQTSSGGYPALPINRWGKSYLPVALPAAASSTTGVTSQLMITAGENGTKVTISPSAETAFRTIGEVFSIYLNAKESYLIQADAQPNVEGVRDLSGTSISSTKPISVVAGHVRAALSGDPAEILPTPVYSAWHAMVQMPSDGGELGKEYISVPMRSGGDRFRLVAQEANTVVLATMYDASGNVVGESTISLPSSGKVVDVYAPEGMSLNGPVRWSSDQPFHVTQLRLSAGDNSNPENSPAMVRLIPTSRYSSRSLFALPTSIRGHRFNPFDLQMIAVGNGNPFESITIDGMQATALPNATIARIAGNTWRLRASIATGSHSINATNGVTFTGHVSGNNGAIGGVALAWELPNWNDAADIERDVTAPRLSSVASEATSVYVDITDSTVQYFSGVETVEAYDSPGWELVSLDRPADPGENVTATFSVRNGVDPSGPLWLLLRDYDGNTRTIKAFDGICQRTAYPASAETVEIAVAGTASQESKVQINASPCGDEAHIEAIAFDPAGSANDHFEDPFIDGSSTPYTILPNGSVEITLRTKADLPGGTYFTILNLTIDGKTTEIPVMLKVETLGVAGEETTRQTLLNVVPNPAVGRTTLHLTEPIGAAGRIEITDARGVLVRSFSGKEHAGTRRIEWNGAEANGAPVFPGVYFITLNDNGKKTTERVLLIR